MMSLLRKDFLSSDQEIADRLVYKMKHKTN